MKIKRFEASGMSEALRKIKKEFGEEAVILSAKTMKKGSRLLGNKRSRHVVVTAAIDKEPIHSAESNAQDVDTSAAPRSQSRQNYSKFSILKHFKPITPTGQKKVKPKIAELMNQRSEEKQSDAFYSHLCDQGLSEDIARDMAQQVSSILSTGSHVESDKRTAMTQILEAMGVVGQQRKAKADGPRVVVMVGPSGAGKTSAVAKLAARHAIEFKEQVGIISLDNQRVAGSAELARYASILNLPLHCTTGAEETIDALQQLSDLDLVVVDTPGLGLNDQILREQVRRILEGLAGAEIYLLLSATFQEDVAKRAVRFFRPLNPQGLFFTQLDWTFTSGPMINRAADSGLPISFLSDSAKVPEGIHTATASQLAVLLLPEEMTAGAADDDEALTVVHKVERPRTDGFVANRNSDIFHREACKSVKRINTQNMIIFKDSTEAMGHQFKPCRMCCSELLLTKTIDRPVHGYAGHRC